MTGYLPVGFELAAEVTYPEPEGTSCGLLNSSAQVFGIAYTYVQGRLITTYGVFNANCFISISLLIGTIITGKLKVNLFLFNREKKKNILKKFFCFLAFIKSDLRRQRAITVYNLNDTDENDNKK